MSSYNINPNISSAWLFHINIIWTFIVLLKSNMHFCTGAVGSLSQGRGCRLRKLELSLIQQQKRLCSAPPVYLWGRWIEYPCRFVVPFVSLDNEYLFLPLPKSKKNESLSLSQKYVTDIKTCQFERLGCFFTCQEMVSALDGLKRTRHPNDSCVIV